MPIGLRFNSGSPSGLFFEIGGFTDFVIHATRKGNRHSATVDANNNLVFVTRKMNESFPVSAPVSPGAYGGIGIQIPISQFELVLKSQYKHGFNYLGTHYNSILNRTLRLSVGIRLR